MILGEFIQKSDLTAYEQITGERIERNFDDVVAEGVDSKAKASSDKFKIREVCLEVQRLGRPLTKEEMENFRIK